MKITKRSGQHANLDVTKIQKQTFEATQGLKNVSQSELELDAQIKFVDGMSSTDVQSALIQTAVEKIDIDAPDWTFVAARLFLNDVYHRAGKATKSKKGTIYGSFQNYVQTGITAGKIIPSLANGYDLDDLEAYIKPERDLQFTHLGVKTLYDRYLLKNNKNEPIELPQQMFMGVAMFLAQREVNKQARAKEFYDVISKFEVMLATPTLSNARTNRHQLSSCYIGSSPDNIEGIMDSYKEQSLLSKFGGGIGWDWNQIRSLGGEIDGTPGAAGGTVPFLKIENDIALAVDQLGTRKGAIAVYLEPWHADIEDFIDLKKNSGEERRRAHDLFPALWIGDDFMYAVQQDTEWELKDPHTMKVTKTIKAKDLWKKILTSYFESGSPFLCFKDNANRANPNHHKGHIRSSNLCTEIFQNTEPDQYLVKLWADNENYFLVDESDELLLDDGSYKLGKKISSLDIVKGVVTNIAKDGSKEIELFPEPIPIYCVEKERVEGKTAVCNLASVNLSKINTKEDMERVVPTAMRMLDNVIDLNFYPLKKVKTTNLQTRAVGLGVMGEAQMLAESGIYPGSQDHFSKIDELMEYFSYYTIKSSHNLAKERGAYPDFEGSNWSKGIFPVNHTNQAVWDLVPLRENGMLEAWQELAELVKQDGVRNGYMMAIAPTSSISILVGTTQAIEPVYKRKWFEENLSGQIPVVVPNLNPDTFQFYVPAYEVEQLNLIKAAAIRQKWIDQGQSLNIFMALQKASGKYLNEIYTLAHKLGLKSTYYLRSQSPEAVEEVQDRSIECTGCQ